LTIQATSSRDVLTTGWLTQVISDPDLPDSAKDAAELLCDAICADGTLILPIEVVMHEGTIHLYANNLLQPIHRIEPGSGVAQIGPGW